MDNISNERLDKFFEEGAKQQIYQYREDAWAAMDNMLDAQDRRRRYIWWLFGIGILLLGVLGAFYFWNSLPATNQAIPNIVNPPAKITEPKTIAEEQAVIEQQSSVHIVKETATNNAEKNSIAPTSASGSLQNKATIFENSIEALDDEVQILLPSVSIASSDSAVEQLSAPTATKDILTLVKPLALSHTILDLETTEALRTNLKPNLRELPRKNGISVGIYAAPEWNSTGMAQSPRIGMRVGVRADKYFAKHFSIGAGIAYSRKLYSSMGDDYHAPVDFFVDGIMPEAVDGKCEVVEIPLEFKYYLRHFDANGFFVGAGLNSYLLRTEWYGFTYNDPNSNSVPEYNSANENQHVLSVLTFTGGYQHRLNDRLNLQVSPYMQLPLTGIGFGQVDLKSAGLSVGLNMKL